MLITATLFVLVIYVLVSVLGYIYIAYDHLSEHQKKLFKNNSVLRLCVSGKGTRTREVNNVMCFTKKMLDIN